jgi:UDP-2,4-diacetamido-2,4,6-trideoxy-beta-L-altropyranose hydrolase
VTTAAPRVALRADASHPSGTGHVVRCLSLAAALRDAGAQPCLLSRRMGLDVTALAQRAAVELIELPTPPEEFETTDPVPHAAWAGVDWQRDADETAQALAKRGCERVVVDHYAFDARWHRKVAKALGVRIAAVDDLADRELAVDLLVDQNLSDDTRAKYAGRIDDTTRLLGGPRYALLGSAYAALAPRKIDDTISSIGIFIGGVDATDLSTLALRACREIAGFRGPIEIATTSAHPRLPALRALAAAQPPTALLVDAPELSGFFARHGLHIGAASGATWERCCAGAPMLLLVAANNQLAVAPQLVAHGAAEALSPHASRDLRQVGAKVAALLADTPHRNAMGQRARGLVDGLGARRVALAMLGSTVKLRAACDDDAAMTHAWRNHPSTREVSRDPRAITLDEHRLWWKRALTDPARRLYVAHVGSIDVGVLRLDLEGDRAEVSIYLDPAYTGIGIGPRLLRAAQSWVSSDSALRRLIAHIRHGNHASESAFAAAGFELGSPFWTWFKENPYPQPFTGGKHENL